MKLSLSRIFTREEPIAGLEISESYLRLTLLEENEKTSEIKAAFFVEEPLADGVIKDGAVADPAKLVAALQNMIKKTPVKVRYAIVSIPGNKVYSRIFSFPKTIQGQKLEESMKLTVGFQLPVKPEDVYLDWEKLESKSEQSEIFLAAIPKPVANAYIDALTSAGLNPVAIEFHPLSFARVIAAPENGAVLVTAPDTTSAAIYAIKDKMLRFARVLPYDFSAREKLGDEARKVKDFYEAEYGQIAKEISLREAEASDARIFPETQKENGKWLVSVGASARGALPRGHDDLVSLMPVGTEEAYEYHKAIIFSEFISNLAIGISVFFAAAFGIVWILMVSIRQRTFQQLENSSSLPIPSDAAALEEKAKNVNDLVGASKEALANAYAWSAALEEIKGLAGAGITVRNVSMPDFAGAITVSGTASNRDNLDAFKKSFGDSSFVAGVKFTPTNLNQTANVPFSVSFSLKDPTMFAEITRQ